MELVELQALPIGSPHHHEGGADILEPNQFADQWSFDGRLAFKREAQFDEEGLGGFQIIDDEEHVIHSFDRHMLFLRALLLPFVAFN